MKACRRLLRCARTRMATAVGTLKHWWRHYRRRVAEDGDYAEALVALALTVTDLITERHRVRYMVHEITAAYVAVLRAFSPSPGDSAEWA